MGDVTRFKVSEPVLGDAAVIDSPEGKDSPASVRYQCQHSIVSNVCSYLSVAVIPV